MLRAFTDALAFLTVLPVPYGRTPSASDLGRSVLAYPAVGLVLGGLLAAVAHWLGGAPPLIAAAVVLALWVGLTGALHLDGLADSADAWLGGVGDRTRTLEIMHDPASGPAAVVVLVLVLILKFAALAHLVPGGHWPVILAIPLIGRSALVWLFVTTPYARAAGLGDPLINHLPRRGAVAVGIASVPLAMLILGVAGAAVLLVAIVGFIVLRWLMVRRIGGTTGDTAGALLELLETATLVTAALLTAAT